MIDTAALKTKVLALALQGKISEHTDENANVLLAHIFEERDLLIKEKLIKKNKTKSITNDEILFTIPTNWLWVRLGDVINLQSGQDLTTSDYNDKELGVPYITGASNFRADESLIINRWTVAPKATAVEGDILLSVKGTVGKLAFLHEEKVHIARQIMGIRPIGLNRKYVKYFVQEQVEELKAISKGLIPGIERDNVLNMLMPMPPLGEQEKIVEKIEEAFAWIDTIDLLQQQYSSDLEILKSKIIDAGIQGKLTEQLPEDGTAEELLKQIAEEKKLLIKEKKIKATKALPEITEDEIPFEIPGNWKWVHLEDTGVLQTGATPPKTDPEYFGNDIPFLSPGEIKDNTIVSYDKQGLSKLGIEKARVVDENSVLQVCIGGSIGKAAINDRKVTFNQQINSVTPILCETKFLFYCMISSQFIGKIQMTSAGAATPIINKSKWGELFITLPPVSEQIRIVERIETILNAINN